MSAASMPEAPRVQREAKRAGGDRDFLVRHCQGDGAAFGEMVTRYRSPVYSYLVRMGVHADARDDLFQDIFLRVHKAASRYDAERPFQPWLFTIVANAVRNHTRRRRLTALRFVDQPPDALREPPDTAPDGERTVAGRETAAWLEGAIRALPTSQREVLVLTTIEHQPLATVAEILRLPLGTVKSRLSRARMSLARALSRRQTLPTEVSS